jgi:hypothetical protein
MPALLLQLITLFLPQLLALLQQLLPLVPTTGKEAVVMGEDSKAVLTSLQDVCDRLSCTCSTLLGTAAKK